jgi:hypothetical protein
MWNKKSPVCVAKSSTAQSDLHLVKHYIQFDPESPEKTQTERTQMDVPVSPAKIGEQDEEALAQPLEAEAEEEQEEPKLFIGKI